MSITTTHAANHRIDVPDGQYTWCGRTRYGVHAPGGPNLKGTTDNARVTCRTCRKKIATLAATAKNVTPA